MKTVLIPMSFWGLTVKSIFRRRDMDMFYIPIPLACNHKGINMKRLIMKAKVSIPLILILIGIGIGVTFYTAHSTGISYAGRTSQPQWCSLLLHNMKMARQFLPTVR